MRRTFWLVPMLLTAACSSGTPAARPGGGTDAGAVQAIISSANARFVEAFKRGDKAMMAANYSDDAWMMMPNEPAWKGKDAISAGIDDLLSKFTLREGSLWTDTVMVNGDLAVETGHYEWTFEPKGTEEVKEDVKDKGKYITVWKLFDRTWKIVRDIDNSDLPPAAPK